MRRRKPILCPGCIESERPEPNHLYYSDHVLCGECSRELLAGRIAMKIEEERKESGEIVTRCFTKQLKYGFDKEIEIPKEDERGWSISISDWIDKAFKILGKLTFQEIQYHGFYDDVRREPEMVLGNPDGKPEDGFFIGTIERIKADQLDNATRYLLYAFRLIYIKGFQTGRNLLHGLASGELSIQDYNEQDEHKSPYKGRR